MEYPECFHSADHFNSIKMYCSSCEDDVLIIHFEVKLVEKSGMVLYTSVDFKLCDGLVRAIVSKNLLAITSCIWKHSDLKTILLDLACKDIKAECQSLCSAESSTFRTQSNECLVSFTFSDQENELKEKARVLLKC